MQMFSADMSAGLDAVAFSLRSLGIRVQHVFASERCPAARAFLLANYAIDHVYEDTLTLITPIQVPIDAALGESINLEIAANWLVCKEACIPCRMSQATGEEEETCESVADYE